jgi:hypothetical protein
MVAGHYEVEGAWIIKVIFTPGAARYFGILYIKYRSGHFVNKNSSRNLLLWVYTSIDCMHHLLFGSYSTAFVDQLMNESCDIVLGYAKLEKLVSNAKTL